MNNSTLYFKRNYLGAQFDEKIPPFGRNDTSQ